MGRSEDLPVSLGTMLDEKYLVDRVIGSGGMAVVYAGENVATKRKVAVKVMRPSLSADHDAVARFEREARAVAALRNAHVAQVLDVGLSPAGDPFIVMELLTGITLQTLVEEEGPLAPERVARIALDVVDALKDAHAAGIIHRDLKPTNVFLVGASAKVLDFGIAKVNGDLGGEAITTTGTMLGTPEYMAPEQLDTKRGVTTKTDVWALGVTMYNALTRKTPFEAESFYELSVKVYAHEPTPVTKHRADLPADLVAVIGGCLQKDARKRLTLEAVAEQLAPYRSDAPDDALTIRDWSAVEVDAAPTIVDPPRRRSRPIALYLGVGVGLALVGLAVAFAVRPASRPMNEVAAPVSVDPAPLDEPASDDPSVVAATPQPARPAKNAPAPRPQRRRLLPPPSAPSPSPAKESGALTHER